MNKQNVYLTLAIVLNCNIVEVLHETRHRQMSSSASIPSRNPNQVDGQKILREKILLYHMIVSLNAEAMNMNRLGYRSLGG